jgi:hypothetical protein
MAKNGKKGKGGLNGGNGGPGSPIILGDSSTILHGRREKSVQFFRNLRVPNSGRLARLGFRSLHG